MSFTANGDYVARRTVQRDCPCGDTMTVTTDEVDVVLDVLFEPFDELHAQCADPCPRCEGTGHVGGSSRGRYTPDTCDECGGSGREARP